MKKILVTLLFIIIGLGFLLSLVDRRGDFIAEKELWKINKDFQKLSKDPQSVPDISFENISKRYLKYMKRFPESKLSDIAHLLAGRVYMLKKDTKRARELLEEVVLKNADNPDFAVEAVAEIGRSYAVDENWEAVFSIYDRVIKEYPMTRIGIQTPLLKANMYMQRNEVGKARQAYLEATSYYQGLIAKNPNSAIAFGSMRMLASVFLAQERWEEGVEVLGKILVNYPQPEYLSLERADQLIRSINTISVGKINNYNLPVTIYERFMSVNPEHKLNAYLKELVKSLKLLQEQNIKIMTQEPASSQ